MYIQFLQEYVNLGHMRLLKNDDGSGYYLPHHAILKQDSLTTKLGGMFDGSASTSTGLSLNNTLMKGPIIQDDLLSIIMRFRTYNYVLTADIEKMYRQVNVQEQDTKFQKILWRSNSDDPVDTYTLQTVTYGATSAPFLAIRFKAVSDRV